MDVQHLDVSIAGWFHQHLTLGWAHAFHWMSGPGSGEWIAAVLTPLVLLLALRRRWADLVMLVATVPGGILLGEGMKLLVHRQRPYVVGPLVDWSGYSFPSGHTIGATLLYGMLALMVVSYIRPRRWRIATILLACFTVMMVAFSRVVLGAHYLSDVLGAMTLGATWLALCTSLQHGIRNRRPRLSGPADSLQVPSPSAG